jgi:cell division protein FtsI/penicillin-binding protein 2
MQHRKSSVIDASRGEIFARDGSWLVARGQVWNLIANPKKFAGDAKDVAEKIVEVISVDNPRLAEKKEKDSEVERIRELLERRNLYWVSLVPRINDVQKEAIEKLDIEGLDFEKEESRFYPEGSSSAHLLGFLGKDESGESVGYFGLEGYYDEMLSGRKGFLSQDADARGSPILFGGYQKLISLDGMDIVTTIDKYIQLVVEKKLNEGVQKYGARAATAIVANPKTGEIYAMASFPSFDPSRYYLFGDEYFINPAISQSFEPGSIFKVIVMASALDAKVVEPDTVCDICDGPLRIDKYFIKTWNNKYHPGSTMTQVIVNSDNVGMSFVGRRLGAERLYDYLQKFGFGVTTGIDLQGEFSPRLRGRNEWREIDVATASFGQGVAVTPIQMVKAVSIIANNGVSSRPHVVKKFKNDQWEYEVKTGDGERVISEKAASETVAMMVEAVKNGESKWTHTRGFKVAGKTGTAQIPIEGHYDEDKTIASFIGFAPYDDPKFIMLVTLREPQSSPWASETAAPLWYAIAKDLFLYFGIQPDVD